LDAEEMRRRVKGARVARLATRDERDRLHLVPICFALADDVLYSAVDEKPKRRRELKRLDNIRARPDVAVLVDHYEEDWSQLWWVRLRGRGRVHEDGPERERGLAVLAEKYAGYRREPPRGAVITVAVEEWLGWKATEGGGTV
jgi:PPOX class probable F420-dependent enzyme